MNGKNWGYGIAAPSSRTVLRTLCFAIAVAAVMVGGSLFSGATLGLSAAHSTAPTLAAPAPAGATKPASTPYTYPTTTQEEPNYTGGKYVWAADEDVEYLNIYEYDDLYSGLLIDELYDTCDNYAINETYIPWACSSYVESTAPAGTMVYDPLTASMTSAAYEWTVTLRPGIQWSDYTTANAGDSYLYSNYTSFSLYNTTTDSVDHYTHYYPWPSVRMNTYTMQSADLILSWEIMVTSEDYSADWANIVDVVPTSNLTAVYYLSAQAATFITETLSSGPILPYHVWVQHDYADSNTAAWNYTGANPSGVGYDTWDVGYNTATGYSSELISSGPFLFTNYAGQPQGQWVPGQYWELYVNPYYFVQYFPSLRQYTPRIAEIYTPLYSTESAEVSALSLGQVDTIENGVDSPFIPIIQTIQGTSIFYQPSSEFLFVALNPNLPAYNVTAFRQALNYATNKAYLASVVQEGYEDLGQPTIPISDSVWHNYSTPQYAYDPTEALSLIAGIPGMTHTGPCAGTSNWCYLGSPVTANIQVSPVGVAPLRVESSLIIAAEWDAIGIPTTVTQEAFSTLVANLIFTNYNVCTLGYTGITGDPTSWFFISYNESVGPGTGAYEGPFSSLTVNGVPMSGPQVTSLMNNLTNELNTNTNFTQRLAIAYEIEGIAAEESSWIILGYPVSILPFSNNTFAGQEYDSLPYASLIYWDFFNFYEKAFVPPTPSATVPVQLHVGAVADSTNVFYNGQFGNVTFEVRNQYGAPVAGAKLSIGYNPTGALLNLTPDSAVTNAQGEYTWEFQVYPGQPLAYTDDNYGEINVSATATAPAGATGTYVPGLGAAFIDVAPDPIAYREVTPPVPLVNGSAPVPVSLEVYNPVTGNPVAGYSYVLEALTGAVNLTPAIAGQAVTVQTSYALNVFVSPPAYLGFASVQVGNLTDYNLTEISGVTGSNGLMTVDVQANSSVNFTAEGQTFDSWLFIGQYAVGAPLSGEAPYSLIAEVTSAFDPSGFGSDVPVEIPLVVTNVAPTVDLSLTVTPSVNWNLTGTVSVTAVNATTLLPIAGYTVVLTAQNAEGANRGILANPSGTEVEVPSPNQYFGNTFVPGIVLTTNASGDANATFSPGIYTPSYAGPLFVGYTTQAYTDPYLVPYDEWQIGAFTEAGGGVASTTLTSNGSATPVAPSPVVGVFLAGSSSLNGVTVVQGNETYALYANSTLDTIWGPSVGSISVNLTTTLGTIAGPSGTTSASGSYSTTYSAPAVTVLTSAVLGVKTGIVTTPALAFYIVPSETTVKTVTTTSTSTATGELYALAAVAAVLAILAIIFAVMWGRSRGKQPPVTQWKDEEEQSSSTSPGGSGGAGGGSSGAGGSAPPT